MKTLKFKRERTGGPSYYVVPGSIYVNAQIIWEMVRNNEEFNFGECNPIKVLMASLKQSEFSFPSHGNNYPPLFGDTEFLNRVIRGGGFVEYIQKLESGVI